LVCHLRNPNIPHLTDLQATDNLDAFDDDLRGIEYYLRLTKRDNTKARALFTGALKLDPRYADAYAGLGWTYTIGVLSQWSGNPQADLAHASELARKALVLDDSNLLALALLSKNDLFEGRVEQALAEGERAIAIDPNYTVGYLLVAEAETPRQPRQAIFNLSRAVRLDPESKDFYALYMGIANIVMARYREAATCIERYVAIYPNDVVARLFLSFAYIEIGRERDGRAQAAKILQLSPQFTLDQKSHWLDLIPKSALAKVSFARRFRVDMSKAGLK
jgi:adenylate cyclase